MEFVATTRMSSKGQVVIPEEVRSALGLEVGARFVVMGEGDTVILKRITVPDKSELLALVDKARRRARRAGIAPADVREAVRRARRSR